MFRLPQGGISRISWERICPKAATIYTSAGYPRSSSMASRRLMRLGCSTGMPFSRAQNFTGEGTSSLLRPFGLSGWVTTAVTSCPAPIRALKATAA